MRKEHAAHSYICLPGIPWQDPNVELMDKIESFLHGLDVLEKEIRVEEELSMFYGFMAAMQLFRLIYATKAHPRTAMLVQTLSVGLDDLLHFLILFCILIGGYMALGHAQFGWYRPEFQVRVCVHPFIFAQHVSRLLLPARALRHAHVLCFGPAWSHHFNILPRKRGLCFWSDAFDALDVSCPSFAACLSQDFESSFRVLWDMMLGSMMESGAIGSAAWTNDPQLLIFQITYCVLMFLIMLNFIIAIIGLCAGGGGTLVVA